ncbi:MAG TPA: SRPBCC domain-containing protein [Enteractinococcus sp.]
MQTTDMTQRFTIARYMPAPLDEVWRAWTKPDAIAEWWHLPETKTPREELEFDVRVGGSYIYTSIHNETHHRTVSGGTFQEVTPPRRLVFTWGAPDFNPERLPIVAVNLDETSDGTYVMFELVGVAGEPGDNGFYDTWDQALARLKAYVGSSA